MRMVVLFDLPTGTREEKRAYATFRKALIEDGFIMEQFSVYTRCVYTEADFRTHAGRVRAALPPYGVVKLVRVSERQWNNAEVLIGMPRRGGRVDPGDQLSILF